MEIYLFRAVRSFVLALIMFFALRTLGFSPGGAVLGALIPLVLGTVDVMAATAFSLTGCIFIFAVAVALFPTQYAMLKNLAGMGMEQVAPEATPSSPDASSNGAVGAKRPNVGTPMAGQ